MERKIETKMERAREIRRQIRKMKGIETEINKVKVVRKRGGSVRKKTVRLRG